MDKLIKYIKHNIRAYKRRMNQNSVDFGNLAYMLSMIILMIILIGSSLILIIALIVIINALFS